MKFDSFDMWLGGFVGCALTIVFFGIMFSAHEVGSRYVWEKAVKAGLAVKVDGEYEFSNEKK